MLNKEQKVQPTSVSGNSTKPIVSGIPQRTYRFRGQKIDGSGWTYGSLVIDSMSNKAAIIDWADIEVGFISYAIEEVKPKTVGQLLTHESNPNFFEGDIITDILNLSNEPDLENCYAVTWENFNDISPTEFIIGNVHDNPELLG